MTSLAVGWLNVILGIIYTSYGVMTWIELRRNWDTRGLSHFGLAWLAMAFTCGPHHFEHGLHVLTTDRVGGGLDMATVLIGLPAGLTWFLLRVEAMRGGRGDRAVSELPAWVEGLPTISASVLAATLTAVVLTLRDVATFDPRLSANLALVVLYTAIGVVLIRTQLSNWRTAGGWSLSGLSLSMVFPTCAMMHGVWVVYGSTGRYDIDGHLLTIDALAVPAAAYFLWVTWSLAAGRLTDWNEGASDVQTIEDAPTAVTAG